MKIIHKLIEQSTLTKVLTIGLVLALGGFLTTTASAQMNGVDTEDIPDEANRIVLIQESVPPANVYVDAYNTLQRLDYTINSSATTLDTESLQEFLDEDPLIFTAEKQVNDKMALRLSLNVEKTAAGGKLVASAEYAENLNAPTTEWKQAKWTDGLAKDAFFSAFETLRNAQYSAIEFESGVAVASM